MRFKEITLVREVEVKNILAAKRHLFSKTYVQTNIYIIKLAYTDLSHEMHINTTDIPPPELDHLFYSYKEQEEKKKAQCVCFLSLTHQHNNHTPNPLCTATIVGIAKDPDSLVFLSSLKFHHHLTF